MRRLLAVAVSLLALTACQGKEQAAPAQQPSSAATNATTSSGDAKNGLVLVGQYGCTTCHHVPGLDGPQGSLAPSLAKIGSQGTIAGGKVKITEETLARYVQEPAAVYPSSTMPPLGMPDHEARDVAAYLLTLK